MRAIFSGSNFLGGNFPCTCFVSKEKFLKNGDAKSNDENMMKSNDDVSSHHGSENEGTCFFG